MTREETAQIADLRDDVQRLEQTIGGEHGLLVRTALVEQAVEAGFADLRTRLDAKSSSSMWPGWKVIGVVLGTAAASFAAGGGVVSAASAPAIQAAP